MEPTRSPDGLRLVGHVVKLYKCTVIALVVLPFPSPHLPACWILFPRAYALAFLALQRTSELNALTCPKS